MIVNWLINNKLALIPYIPQGIQPPVLVFVQSKERAKELFHELIYDGMNVDVIHADRTQTQVPDSRCLSQLSPNEEHF